MSKKNTNQEEKKKSNIVLYSIIAVLVLLVLFFAFKGSDNGSNTNIENPDNNNQDNSNLVNSNTQDNTNTASDDDIEGLIGVRFEMPSEVKLFDDKGVTAFVTYDTKSEFKDSVKVTIESIDASYKKSFTIPYSRTGSEVSKNQILELNDKEDINSNHEFVVYMEYRGEVIMEEKFQVKVLPEYAFTKDLTANVKVQDTKLEINIAGYPDDLKDKTNFTFKSNNEVIFSKNLYGYYNEISFGWWSTDPNKEKYTNLVNPTIDIYDNDRELYIVKDLPVSVS